MDGISSTEASEEKKVDPLADFVNSQVKRICEEYEGHLAAFVAASVDKYELRGREVLAFYEKELLEDRLHNSNGGLQQLSERIASNEVLRTETVVLKAVHKTKHHQTLRRSFSAWKLESSRAKKDKQEQQVVEWKYEIEEKFKNRITDLQRELAELKVELESEERERAELEKKFKGFLHQGLEIVRESQH